MNIAVTDYRQLNEDYLRIEQAILYLEKNAHSQPELSRDRERGRPERIPLPASVHTLGRYQP